MRSAFNLGIGLVAVIGGHTDRGVPIGRVEAGAGGVRWA
jgi:hypothetical protein